MMTDIDGGMPETGSETSGLSVPLMTRGHTAAAANASRLRRMAALLQAPPAGFPGPGTKFSRPRTAGQRRRFPSFFHSGRFITFGHVFFIFSAYDEKTPFKAAKQSVFQYKTGLQIKINMLKLDKRRQIFYDKKAVSKLNKERWKKLAQKAGDKIRQGSLRLAMLMTTLIGNGSATGSNPPAESSSSSEKTTITAPAVKTERADSIDTVDMTQLMSEQLISSNKNIAGNFNLEGRTFTAEELAEIG